MLRLLWWPKYSLFRAFMRIPVTLASRSWLCLRRSYPGSGQARGLRLQLAVDDAMSGAQGAVVVLDVATGRLLAKDRLDLASRRVVRPGSTVKPFSLLAMIDS